MNVDYMGRVIQNQNNFEKHRRDILSKKIVTIVLKAKNSDTFAFNFSRFI